MRPPLAALAAAALLAVATPPAGAETWNAPDAHHDVYSYTVTSEPPPCGTDTITTDPTDRLRDIIRLRVEHAADAVVVTIASRQVKRRNVGARWGVHLRVPAGAFLVEVIRFGGKSGLDVSLTKEPHFPPASDCGTVVALTQVRPCDGLSAVADPRRDTLEVTVPRVCLKGPRWVKVGAETTGGFTGSPDDFTIHSDAWAPDGVESSFVHPFYGPRVHQG